MTRKELNDLPIGTLIYNGHTEGTIKKDCAGKYIEVWIPIRAMSDDSKHFDERPGYWMKLDD